MKGYDEYNTILLPPYIPGQGLPHELAQNYEELEKQKAMDTGTGVGTEATSVVSNEMITISNSDTSVKEVTADTSKSTTLTTKPGMI